MADTQVLHVYDDFVRRLAAAIRGATLYSSNHPLVQRGIDTLIGMCVEIARATDPIVIGFIGDEVVVNAERLPKSAAALLGFARDMREREIEKISIHRGVTREELRTFIFELRERHNPIPLPTRLQQKGVTRIVLGRLSIEKEEEDQGVGIAAARKVYGSAVETAEQLWLEAKSGEKPDPNAARMIIDSLAKMVGGDRTSLLALTSLKRYDNYTFTHMVNVSVLAMAQARALNLEGTLLREFGFAALMHDIGKVNTPHEVLNKPDRLTSEEFDIMQRHVVDGAHILRRTPEMPALAPIVAFEHHLRQDLSGYPRGIGHRNLNLCTQIVSIADVYDALRSTRVYRDGLPSDRIKSIMGKKDDPSFNQRLLRRFINLIGLFPIGTLVRLSTEEIGVVTHEHPTDPFRPQVKVVRDRDGGEVQEALLVNTWEPDGRGDYPVVVLEAVDPEAVGIDPIGYM
ncbi:MAG TPA: HD-GYP domain-containing protein [Vicinamibacterales bacterium]|nr:HD-GYP domain-containing protein [Vicinamibacterales bacterium]